MRLVPSVVPIAIACAAMAVEARADSRGEYESRVQPLLAKYCYNCHNEKTKTGNISLEGLRRYEAVTAEKPRVWEHVFDAVSLKKMPPPGAPGPTVEERKVIEGWISGLPGVQIAVRDPGRVTARRLNRAEYNNTIRDLLGVPLRPADDFPVDDSGYGFDNNGDVLSLSPMLMEKYLATAKRIARAAVVGVGAEPMSPSILAHYLGKRSADAESAAVGGNAYLPYSMRGALYGTFVFPVAARYEFRFRVVDRRLDESKAVPVVLSIDGKPVFDGPVEGGRQGNYHRGEYTARVPVPAGAHVFRVSFPHLADRDPRDNVAKDKIRKLFVEYLDIVGPFDAAPVTAVNPRVVSCGHGKSEHKADCPRMVTANLARRAWRREPTAAEVDGLTAMFRDNTFEHGLELVVRTLLSSADFLFRFERTLGEYELASRLSYFLWSSMPDDELLRLAGEKKLSQPAVLRAQVQRMLADAKADALVENFAGQWLQLRSLARAKPDPARFPTVDDELLDAMRAETTAFVRAIFRENRPVLDLLDAPFTFVNGPLARHYGIEGVSGELPRRVELKGERRGLLTQASILTVSSYPTRTSPVIRGKWVLENILGAPPPPPPPNVPLIEESKIDPNVSFRKQLEQHRVNPTCAACHNQMDQIGFGFENYDAVGAWRTHEGNNAVDASGTLPGGRSFSGPLELIGILKGQSEAFGRTFAEKLLTFALGRGLERYDREAVERITQTAARDDFRFSTLVNAIVESEPFRVRGTQMSAGGR
jgi:hypothetical protein